MAKLTLPAFSIIIVFVMLSVLGLAVIPILPLQLEPSISRRAVSISYSWQGASAEMTEREVTMKLEGVVSTVRGIKNISSTSSDGGGRIQLELDNYVNLNEVRYEIATLVRQVYTHLPAGVSFPQVSADGASGKKAKLVLSYTINGSGRTTDIQHYVEKTIRPYLAQVNGVNDIIVYGAGNYAWQLTFRQSDLIRYQVTADNIRTAIRLYFSHYAMGPARISAREDAVTFIDLRLSDPATVQWDKVPVKRSGDRMIYLNSLATAKLVEQGPRSFYRLNGLNTIKLDIIAAKNTNFIALARDVKQQIAQIKKVLPSSYSVTETYDATRYLKKELGLIGWRSLATFLILMTFVFAASREWHYLLIISASLVVNLLLAFIFYYIFKLQIHFYSLAAVTVSMGMIIDNSIVVIDHILHKRNMRVFLAIAGATLTIIGAVCIVFFLRTGQQAKLLDFAWIMIVNLSVSIAVSLLFVPALMQKITISVRSGWYERKRRIIKWNHFYSGMIITLNRYKVVAIIAYVLIFGLPVFLLPRKIEQQNGWAKIYNATFGSSFYNANLRTWIDKCLGGTLRLFLSGPTQFSYEDTEAEETRISIAIKMPKGSSLSQINQVALSFENYISQFGEIRQFETHIYSALNGSINILFKKEYSDGTFPYVLKSDLESKAIYTGLAEFNISGVGQGFNNEFNTEITNYGLTLLGYNYTELKRIADRVKERLLENPRVERILIKSERDYLGEGNSYELVFRIRDQERLLLNQLSQAGIGRSLSEFSANELESGRILFKGNYIPILLHPNQQTADMWQVMNEPVRTDSGAYLRLKEFADLDKESAGDAIVRNNQQYQLTVNYNFIGQSELGTIVSDEVVKAIRERLPLGYSITGENLNFWSNSSSTLTWAIFITIGIVFTICAVLLNSIRQPLAVIAIIPFSFIGVFVSSWVFEYPFDEGGYAAFIILSGVVVTAVLFILNDYNNLLKDKPLKDHRRIYIKAYSSKIIPVVLTRFSMILGLIPFLISSNNDPFWYALSLSVIGGLLFSIPALIVFLPLFLKNTGRVAHG